MKKEIHRCKNYHLKFMTAQENWLMHLPLTVVVSGGPGAADFFRTSENYLLSFLKLLV